MSLARMVQDPAITALTQVLADSTRTIQREATIAFSHAGQGEIDAAVGTVLGIAPALRDALSVCETIILLQRLRNAQR